MATANTLRLRPATIDDTPVIHTLIGELAAYEKLAHQVVATPEALAATLFGGKPAAEVIIAEDDGAAIGFALFFTNYSTFLARPGLYLEDLFVRPAARGRGVGKALLSHLAALAVARGYGRFEWSVLDWNTDAIGFYERLGAKPLDAWTMYRVTGDALVRLAAARSPRP